MDTTPLREIVARFDEEIAQLTKAAKAVRRLIAFYDADAERIASESSSKEASNV